MGLFDGKVKVGGIIGAVAKKVGEAAEAGKEAAARAAENASEKKVTAGSVARWIGEKAGIVSKPLDPETVALIERVKNNKIFTDFADETFEQFNHEESYPVEWILGENPNTRFSPKLYLFAGTKSFGLFGEYLYKNSQGQYAYDGFEAMEVRLFEDLKMKDLPDIPELQAAVVETMASRLWEAPYVTPGKPEFKAPDMQVIQLFCDTKKLKKTIEENKEAEKSAW